MTHGESRSMHLGSPDELPPALRIHMATQFNDGLFIVSMDHSPSEQLTGAGWHTTALVLSAGVDHAKLAKSLALRLRPKVGTLTKWANASRAYRRSFLSVFIEELRAFPSVYVFAISAQETVICSCISHFVNELGLNPVFRRDEVPGATARIVIGPLVRASTGEEFTFTLSENRAVMCLFVGHFVVRMKQRMYEAVNAESHDRPEHVNWSFLGDKFPGPPDSDMDLMFQVLTSLHRDTGRITWGYFREGDTVETDLLADNLAGALNATVQKHYQPLITPSNQGSSGFFYWERWV